ncbi:MAG TPA: deaminase, partial [Candidatus Saccharimonadales bacterium]|nr:deaminase [Candidatus Saccharimonadales bacterium]
MRLFDRYPEADIAIFDQTILSQFDYLRKDIRALRPETVNRLLGGLGRNSYLVGRRALSAMMSEPGLIMPDDDISRQLLSASPDSSARLEPVFLRWDRRNVEINQTVVADRVVGLDSQDPLIQALYTEADKSSNWWRRVGAAVVHDGEIEALSRNSSMPTDYSSLLDSDPRIIAKRGQSIETSIDIHAEARLIARLARSGRSSSGKDIYVTTFPCPNCAKLIAESGLKRCYFVEGYAMLDGETVLRANSIELIKIDTEPPTVDPKSLKTYPS